VEHPKRQLKRNPATGCIMVYFNFCRDKNDKQFIYRNTCTKAKNM